MELVTLIHNVSILKYQPSLSLHSLVPTTLMGKQGRTVVRLLADRIRWEFIKQ